MSARIIDCTAAEYHADPCYVPSLSSSIARILISESPAHAWQAHPRFGGGRKVDPTDQMDSGTVIHALVLGRGMERVEVVEFDDFRTNKAKEQRDAARAAGKVPLIRRKYDWLHRTADKIRDEIAALGIFMNGQSEAVIVWDEPVPGTNETVVCRAQIDHLLDYARVIDLKTGETANPEAFARKAVSMGYDIQQAAYTSAVRELFPDMAGLEDFVFVACELEEPLCVTPIRLSGTYRELGERRWQRAVSKWHECMKAKRWPGYAVGKSPIVVEPPAYALAAEAF